MGDDQARLGITVDERPQAVGDRRQATAAVDQDRHAPLGGEREHGAEPLVRGGELLCTRVELDPAGTEVEAAAGLLDRRLVEVEAHERDQPALAPRREFERTVVRCAERGVMVGLVEAEHEGARQAVLGHERLELVVVADHAVDVVPEVEVCVEEVGARRQQLLQLGVVALDQRLCSVARLHQLDPS